jgi:hypothetical protein
MKRARALAGVGAVFAALAVFAAPAMAEPEPAEFSGEIMRVTTNGITVELDGKEPKTCTLKNGYGEGEALDPSTFWVSNESLYDSLTFNCTGGTTFQMMFIIEGRYDESTGGFSVVLYEWCCGGMSSPWGVYAQSAPEWAEGTFVNGTEETPSKIVYDDALVGEKVYPPTGDLTISGTIEVDDGSGGLLTLSP